MLDRRLSVTVLGSVALIGCGGSDMEMPEEVSVTRQAIDESNPCSDPAAPQPCTNARRSTSAGSVATPPAGGAFPCAGYSGPECLKSPWQYIPAGYRQLIKLVGTGSSADVLVVKSGVGLVNAAYTPGTSTEIIDWVPSSAGWYRVVAFGTGASAENVRFTSDIVDPSQRGGPGAPVGWCFGAVGSNCDGIWPNAPCGTNADATVWCQVSVGSQLHDTCCAQNPNGQNCGGNNSSSACGGEWSHAVNDTSTTRQFTWTFDPTVPSYPNDVPLYYWDQNAKPTAIAYRTPTGKALWDVDAQNGFCASGSYDTYWSVQGYYSVCKGVDSVPLTIVQGPVDMYKWYDITGKPMPWPASVKSCGADMTGQRCRALNRVCAWGDKTFACLPEPPPPTSCPCLPDKQNFCDYPKTETNCPMVQPYGYCDPDGNGWIEGNGDWVRGWNEYHQVCLGQWPAPESCPCLPDKNNFCQYPAGTPGCPMVAAGGYCDPDGNGWMEGNGDWVRGWNEYQATCM